MAEVLTKTGVVKAVQGHMALVLTKLEPECEGCKAKDACTSLGGGGANAEIRARNTVGAEAGDVVTISLRGSSLLKASFLVYMLPILAIVGGIVLGHLLSRVIPVDESILVGFFGLFAFSGVFVWLRKQGNKFSRKQEFIPEIISKKTPQEAVSPANFACPVE